MHGVCLQGCFLFWEKCEGEVWHPSSFPLLIPQQLPDNASSGAGSAAWPLLLGAHRAAKLGSAGTSSPSLTAGESSG